ncbi:MAG: multiheme c-type cytochrome [Phycisphaerae bacterium]|nr:multiheme c-type cytochrome [Phycisphaerae bacterium]
MIVRADNPLRRRCLVVGACAFVMALWLCSCGKDTKPESGTTRVVVVVSGDTAGWIIPCGCTTHQSGGLLRRGAYVEKQKQEADVVLLDVGGAPGGTSPYQRLKFEAILKGERLMGLAAHNVGGPEVALGLASLQEAARKTGVRFISANLRDPAGQPIFDSSTIVESAGRRVAVIGVISPKYAAGDVRIEDPKAAVLTSLQQLEGRHDGVVVLAYLPEDELQRLAAELPEVDAVIGGATGQAIAPRAVGLTVLAAATNKGKFLVQLEFTTATQAGAPTGQVVELTDDWPDDRSQLANLKQYLDELDHRAFEPDQTGLVPSAPPDVPPGYQIAGSDTCRECHERDNELWDASRHAKAWMDLRAMGRQVDPYCQQCHTTGYGLPGGFVTIGKSPDRLGVGCESCHGPSQVHVEEPERRTPFDAKDQCTRCHDHENSPSFGYERYWEKIKHGETKGTLPDRFGTRPASTEAQP